MSSLEGNRDRELRQRRERLSISRPCVETALGSLEIDGYDIAETRLFGNRMQAAVERFMVGRFGTAERRVSKSDANRMWAQAFAGMQPVKGNRLSRLRAGGGQ